jgi:hypothetical protein
MQTDLGMTRRVNVWVINNWQDIDSCIGTPKEALSRRAAVGRESPFTAWPSQYARRRLGQRGLSN